MTKEKGLEKPRALITGDWVGLIAPSSPFNKDELFAGIKFLESLGLQIRYHPSLLDRKKGLLAGDDRERSEELQFMFQDPDVRAIFTVRGGYGAQRILEMIDPEILIKNPKIFVGYSDVTCLLSFLLDRCGLVCFHGPMVNEMGSLSQLTRHYLGRALMNPEPLDSVPLENPIWINKGVARAPLIGGNLSLMCSTLGTPWEIKTAGRILFLEDRGEMPYRIDRMMVQMKQAGKFSSIAGLLFGDMLGETGQEFSVQQEKEIKEVLHENTRDLGVPVVLGLPSGHGKTNIPLPLGVLGELNGNENRFSILEPALRTRE